MASLTVPSTPANPRQDAMDLHKAFKGFGCDTAAVVNILAHRDASIRPRIEQEYKSMYSEELTQRLSSELSGHLKRAVLLWILDPATRDAVILKDALTENDDPIAVNDIICSRTPSQLQMIKHSYYARSGSYPENDIHRKTSGHHMNLLLAYIGTLRHEGPEVDPWVVENDVKALFEAGEKKLGTDEKAFIRIFTSRTSAHLAAVSYAYHDKYGRVLEEVVKMETSGHFMHALLTILRCAQNPAMYFAKVLRKSMKGMGTDDKTLTRVIVTRAEIDMLYIKAEYHKKYYNKHHKSLIDEVHSKTSGNYRTFLLALLGPNQH